MARKSNKTAHVLNLIAGHEAPKDAAETPAAPVSTGKRTSVPSAPISSQSIAVIDTTEEDPVSDLIQEKLSDEFNEPDPQTKQETPTITESELQNDSKQESEAFQQPEPQTVTEPEPQIITEPETASNLQADIELEPQAVSKLEPEASQLSETSQQSEISQQSEQQTVTQGQTVVEPEPQPITESQIITEPEPQAAYDSQTDVKPEPQASSKPESPAVPEPEPDFVRVNVMERIVEDKIIYFMRQFDVCTCDRCVNDTIALTLSGLLPKYIVTTPAAVDPLLSYYTNKYISDVTVEATKACMIIKDNPRH